MYASFGENHGKLERLGRQARPGIESGASRVRTAQPLVGLRTDNFNIHAFPGIRTRERYYISRLPWPLHHLIGLRLVEFRFGTIDTNDKS